MVLASPEHVMVVVHGEEKQETWLGLPCLPVALHVAMEFLTAQAADTAWHRPKSTLSSLAE